MIIKNAILVLEDREEKGSLRIRGKKIDRIERVITPGNGEKVIDAEGSYLMPGFVDLHTHGAGGYDFMDGDESDIINASLTHAMHGTTMCLPTSLTSSDNDLLLFLKNFNSVKRKREEGKLDKCSKMPGVHLEGPYFAQSQKGAQDERYIREPEESHYRMILENADGAIKRWSVAPELNGALKFIRDITQEGILASGGHTDATYDEISRSYDAGLRMLTHFYSGMSGIKRVGGFRVLGAIEAGYLIDDLYVELIADGMHLPPDLLEYIFRFKKHDRITACTDSMRGAGLSDGPSILGPKNNGTECIIEDGIAKMPDRSCFAGSVATGDRLLRTLHQTMKMSMTEASKLLSLTPASLIGMDNETGSIKEGKDADLVIVDESCNIKKVFIDGIEI